VPNGNIVQVSTAQSSIAPPILGVRPLFGTRGLSRADRTATSRHHLPAIVLMEQAGAGAAAHILSRYPHGAATVVCGAGNNGGDGYVVARHLADAGWDVQIATLRGLSARTDDAMTMARAAASLGLRAKLLHPRMLQGERLIIDALLGIGTTGALREPIAAAVRAINRSGRPVVALDVPTGIDADNGEVPGDAIEAELTITFHGDKVGLHVDPARAFAGEVITQPIGIPRLVTVRPDAWLMEFDSAPVPPKGARSSKYQAGAVLVVAGSPGLTGAGVLTARAGLRCGGGLIVAAVPATVQPLVAEQTVEVMVAPIPDVDGYFGARSLDAVIAQTRRVGAIALGPGLGRDPRTRAFVRGLLDATKLPVVIDADGLWHLGTRPGWLKRRTAPTLLTPHTGEAARLLGVDRAEVDAARLHSARRLARMTGATTILKGPGQIVIDPAGTVLIDGVGTEALATAGSGDVLTGIVAAMLARGLHPLVAAATASTAHARAGLAAGRGDGTVAGDLIEALPEVIAG
jgi:NAD(P)H-hydrate epimerase